MCGIFGILLKDMNKAVNPQWVRDITAAMVHRGPDDDGVYTDKNVGLGHRRLSIIDLSGGHQPVFNENGSVCVVFNGEIYNFIELRNELETAGHKFLTKSDTEVIVHSYEEWGKDCINKLRGMFAFAIYDKAHKRLFIARDRVGIKPLYFYNDRKAFVFSSEIKPILKTGFVLPEVNTEMIDFYMTLGYVPAPQTLFKNIYKLEPGHYMIVDKEGVKESEYWSIKIRPNNGCEPSFSESSEKLLELLSGCVRSHLLSDVPVGVFLSGGIDSSTVVGLMSQMLNTPVQTYSVGYDDAVEVSELGFAKKIAEKFKTEHHEFILKPSNFIGSVETFLYYSEEPIVESAAIALYQLSKLARSTVTVLLSGEGADELFGGYPLYWKMGKIESLYQLLRFAPSLKADVFFRLLPEKFQKYLSWATVPFEQRYKTVPCDITTYIKNRMYTKDFKKTIDGRVDVFFEDIFLRLSGKSILQKMLYIDTKYWLPDDLLLKADKMTMATSVELRVPFLDHKLLEFAFNLPDNYKTNGAKGKLILKKAVEGILPEEIIHRQKRGFPVPISKWFSSDFYQVASEILLDNKALSRGYFNRAYMENILRDHNRGRQDLSRRIFSLVILELWHRAYIDRNIYGTKKISI